MAKPSRASKLTLSGAVDDLRFEVIIGEGFSKTTPSNEECELIYLLLRDRFAEILEAPDEYLQLGLDGTYRVVEQLSLLAEQNGEDE